MRYYYYVKLINRRCTCLHDIKGFCDKYGTICTCALYNNVEYGDSNFHNSNLFLPRLFVYNSSYRMYRIKSTIDKINNQRERLYALLFCTSN